MAHAESHDHGHHDAHSDAHMVKIYFILLALLVVSLIGPEVAKGLEGGLRTWVVLITAFGIAFVKAWLVVKNFMHLTVEKPIVRYILVTCLAFMVLFFAGTSPDVMLHQGRNWENQAAAAAIERAEMEHAQAVDDEYQATGRKEGKAEVGHSKVTHGPGVENPPGFEELPTAEAKQLWLMKTGELIWNDGAENATGSACVMCHRQDGAGYSGLASSLAGATDAIGTCQQAATAILKGTAGDVPLEDGTTRRSVMPGFSNLDDKQVAALATYVRNSFGNKMGVCMPADVASAR